MLMANMAATNQDARYFPLLVSVSTKIESYSDALKGKIAIGLQDITSPLGRELTVQHMEPGLPSQLGQENGLLNINLPFSKQGN